MPPTALSLFRRLIGLYDGKNTALTGNEGSSWKSVSGLTLVCSPHEEEICVRLVGFFPFCFERELLFK